jgi:hypothetical protein
MFPTSSLKNIFYPMTSEIYYAENKQDALGVVQKSWVYDRTVKCSVISTMSDRSLTSEIKSNSSNFNYNQDLLFRVGEDIQEKKNGTIYPITEILITNVKDPSGKLVFKEKGEIPTQYEIKTFVPSYDGDHLVSFWRGYISRSTKQNEVIY